jgi:lichenan operon transcriptional antiterminator
LKRKRHLYSEAELPLTKGNCVDKLLDSAACIIGVSKNGGMMFDFDRLDKEFLLIRDTPYISPARLADMFSVTPRTIRSDIASINKTLEKHGGYIRLKRRSGYYLTVDDAVALERFQNNISKQADDKTPFGLDSSDDRIRSVIELLLVNDGPVRQSDIATATYVSDSTVQGYIRQIKDILARYGLKCIVERDCGVFVFGSESDKRSCFLGELLPHGSRFDSGLPFRLFSDLNLNAILRLTVETLDHLEVRASDYGLRNLLDCIFLMLSRAASGHEVEESRKGIPEDVAGAVNTLASNLESATGITLSSAERSWLYRQLVAHTNIGSNPSQLKGIAPSVSRFLETIYRDYGYDFRSDGQLMKAITAHIESVFKSREAGNNIPNPLLWTIKKSFPLAFEIALGSARQVFSEKPYILDENDIGYIALHVGAAIERNRPDTVSKVKAVVVCDAGRAPSAMLVARINSLFADRIEVVSSISTQSFALLSPSELASINLVFSTTRLHECPCPLLIVDFRVQDDDVKLISHWLATNAEPISRALGDVFDEKLFLIIDKDLSKEAVVSRMCDSISATGTVSSEFHELVCLRERASNTALGKRIAIPHPIRLCATKTKIAVAVLRYPIVWGQNDGNKVQLVFLLSMEPKIGTKMERLYDLLVRIANDEKTQREMIAANSFQDFLSALDQLQA